MATSIRPDVEVVVSGGSGNRGESIMDYEKRFDEANAAFIKQRDEADSAFAEKTGRTNPEVAGNRELEGVSITIEPDKPEAGKFVIKVNTTSPEGVCGAPFYRAEAYGEAPNVRPATFPGSLSLTLPGGWNAFLKPPEVTFGWVECSGSDFMGWEVSIDNKAVMTFGGFVPRDEALVGKGGKMVWEGGVGNPMYWSPHPAAKNSFLPRRVFSLRAISSEGDAIRPGLCNIRRPPQNLATMRGRTDQKRRRQGPPNTTRKYESLEYIEVEGVVGGGNSAAGRQPIMDFREQMEEARAAFIKQRDEADSAFAQKTGRTNSGVARNRDLRAVSITIVPDNPKPGKFVIQVNTTGPPGAGGGSSYRAEAYGDAPNVTPATFSGSLSLTLLAGWDAFMKPPEVTFGWVECSGSDFMGWEVYIDNKAVMTFGGFVPRDEALVGKGGKMIW
ncbi:hypothetical protein FRC01_000330 [Tulasnella sp. 417]|nr:hypothetical protein FRC01_000330 [Tulasnella sp. 417]